MYMYVHVPRYHRHPFPAHAYATQRNPTTAIHFQQFCVRSLPMARSDNSGGGEDRSSVVQSKNGARSGNKNPSTIARTTPGGKKVKGYRPIEYMLRHPSCVTNKHLCRLTGGGTAYRRPLYDATFTSGGDANDTASADTQAASKPPVMEPWAEEFMRLVLYDELMSNVACKGKKLRKDIVDGIAIIDRVEHILGRLHAGGVVTSLTRDTGKDLLLFDLCSGKFITGIMLTTRFPDAKIVGVDIRPPNPSELHLREKAFPNVERLTGSIYDSELIKNVVNQTPKDGTCIVTATHLCGDLSRLALSFIDQYPDQISATVVAPCCLMRQKKPRNWMPGDFNGFGTTQTARGKGIDPFDLWVDQLFHYAPVKSQNKEITVDLDMLSPKNRFIHAYANIAISVEENDDDRKQEEVGEPLLCREIGACVDAIAAVDT